MHLLRALLLRHRALAVLAIAAALCLKAVVPAGYMLDSNASSITVRLCNDASGASAPTAITIPIQADGSAHPDDPASHKAAAACPYTALTLATLGGADLALLALALVFLLALGFAPVPTLRAIRPPYLRPPLRAPPALV